MRAKEFVYETARGLLYRSAGDKFKNEKGQEIEFSQVSYFPGQPGAYKSKEELDAVVAELVKKYPELQFANKSDASSRALAMITFIDTQTKKPVYFARYFKQILGDMAGLWKNNGLPGNWQLQKAVSLKSSYRLKPSDIFKNDVQFKSPPEIISAMEASESGAPFAKDIAALLQNKLPIFHGAGEKETAIRDDLGEVIGPMALVQGLIKTPGSEEARRILNNNKPWAGAISFPSAKNYGLIDSELALVTGVKLGISSKGDKGAKASIKNVYEGIETLRKNDPNSELLKEYKDYVEILESIAKASAFDAPFILLENYSVDFDSMAPYKNAVTNLVKTNAKDLSSIEDGPLKNGLTAIMSQRKAQTTNDRYNAGYHILAVLAEYAAKEINNLPKFGEACLKFLNSAPIIQIHTKTKKTGDDVAVVGFDAIYPPNFKGTVRLVANKVYSATGIIGRYSFSYDAI